jgi:hypothetical protein
VAATRKQSKVRFTLHYIAHEIGCCLHTFATNESRIGLNGRLKKKKNFFRAFVDPRSPSMGIARSPLVLRDVTADVARAPAVSTSKAKEEYEEGSSFDLEDNKENRVLLFGNLAPSIEARTVSTPMSEAKAFLSSPALWRTMQEASPATFKSPGSATHSEPASHGFSRASSIAFPCRERPGASCVMNCLFILQFRFSCVS